MKIANNGLLALVALVLTACGGGSATTETPQAVSAAQCDPSDPSTQAECGTLLLAITDADGEILNYSVDVLSLELETTNGRVIEALPRRTRINFTDYVDMTELVTAATIPPATYVSGTIRLDYADAEIFVEASGAAKAAVVKDMSGNKLTRTELKIHLSNRDRLVIAKGHPALLQLDFDLAASHLVDTAPTPAEAVSEQFILAEVSPVDNKDLRVRGLLAEVSEDEMSYTVIIRPFHDHDGDFGRFKVHVTGDTEFAVNEQMFAGFDGLRALRMAGNGTPTVAAGTLNIAEREFTARIVLAGSSVPGFDMDAVIGNVTKRDGNMLTVRGATIVPADRRAHFHDDVVVEIGPETRVFRDGHRIQDIGIDVISVGQRVTIRGDIETAATDASSPRVLFGATKGAVRMHLTNLFGIVNTVMPGQTDITLHGIDRRRVQIFDFTGTGPAPDLDADPGNYEIATGDLTLANFASDKPIVARGFPSAFGTAPPDFAGRTVIDYTDVRSVLGVAWGIEGTAIPFADVGPDRIVLDNDNPDIGIRHHVKQGPVLIDLTAVDSDTTIVPRESDRSAFYIKTADSLRMYSEFADFIGDLELSIDGATKARSMHARGKFDTDTNVFTAYRIGICLIEP